MRIFDKVLVQANFIDGTKGINVKPCVWVFYCIKLTLYLYKNNINLRLTVSSTDYIIVKEPKALLSGFHINVLWGSRTSYKSSGP